MATSQDDIQAQHREAERLIQEGIPFQKAKGTHEIPLAQKACPIYKLDDKSKFGPYWTTRGHADVSQLQALVREGYNRVYNSGTETEDGLTEGSAEQASSNTTRNSSRTTKAEEKAPAQSPNRRRRRYAESDVASKTNLWDPANAAVHNVAICRPSHDAWGIHKIVLLFCDDFLQRTYALPWWHGRPDVRDAVQPILNVLGIPMDCVVRLLLASLPPGVTIPVHEDSGAWVSQTHRVHVPILVSKVDQILFRCGATVDTLERIETSPGHVFEMNNQAKHAVSNCSNDYRVHLILDYVDPASPSLPPRIPLDPGEVLVQTRRSIDRWNDRGSRPTPSFLILGAQKAGTTSLFEYMVQHPLIVRAKRRETHCLDWRWNENLATTDDRRKWCLQFYHHEELYRNPSCQTGDSTPSYLLDSKRVIPRLQQVFDWRVMKFLVMLRNPVKRAESHYAMVTSTEGTPAQLQARGSEWRQKSFRQVVMEDLEHMERCGLIPYWNIDDGTLDEKLFDSFAGSDKENAAWDAYLKDVPLHTGSHCLLGRGLYALNLRPWMRAFDKSQFLVLPLEQLHTGNGVSLMMDKVWAHVGVPPYQVQDQSAKNTRAYDSLLDPQLQSYLERFFEPHNRQLVKLLGKDYWENVWTKNDEEQENCPQQQS